MWVVNFQRGYHDRARNAKEIVIVGGILVTFVCLDVAPPFRSDKGCNILSEINCLIYYFSLDSNFSILKAVQVSKYFTTDLSVSR